MNKYSNQERETEAPCVTDSLQSLIDTQTNMLCELEERIEILGKILSPLRNPYPTDPCPEPSVPFTCVVNNLVRENNLRIGRFINHVNLINQEIEL